MERGELFKYNYVNSPNRKKVQKNEQRETSFKFSNHWSR